MFRTPEASHRAVLCVIPLIAAALGLTGRSANTAKILRALASSWWIKRLNS